MKMPSLDQGAWTLLVALVGGAISQGAAVLINRLNAKDAKSDKSASVQSEQSRLLFEQQGGSIKQLWDRLDAKDRHIDLQDAQLTTLQRQVLELEPKAAKLLEMEVRLNTTEANFREFVRLVDAARREVTIDGAIYCIPNSAEAVTIYRDLIRRGILSSVPRTAAGHIIEVIDDRTPQARRVELDDKATLE